MLAVLCAVKYLGIVRTHKVLRSTPLRVSPNTLLLTCSANPCMHYTLHTARARVFHFFIIVHKQKLNACSDWFVDRGLLL